MNKKHLNIKRMVIPVLTAYFVLLAAGNPVALGASENDLANIIAKQDYFVIEYVDDIQAQSNFEVKAVVAADEGSGSAGVVTSITDIRGHWARENILEMVAIGGIKGYEDHTFRPNNTISAAELASILIGASGNDNTVASGNWANGIMEKARNMDITGIQNADASKPITREQMADMLIRSADKLFSESTGSMNTSAMQSKIGDYNSIQEAYKQSVLKCYAMGLLEGKGGSANNYGPKDSTTRAEAATICARLVYQDKRVAVSTTPDSSTSTKLLWIGDTITVNGVTYTIEKDPATGVIGRGIPAAIWEGYHDASWPAGVKIEVGNYFPAPDINGYELGAGAMYIQDPDTGEAHSGDDWMYIEKDLITSIKKQNGGKWPTNGNYDILGNKIEDGSNIKAYIKITDGIPLSGFTYK
jgi:hypothetical protein